MSGNPPDPPNPPDPLDMRPGDRLGLLRILDANANRASEGLRVVEEYLRFVLEDAYLASLCKQLRHDLRRILSPLDAERPRARDTAGDVGTAITTESEYQRPTVADVALANWKRVEQAMRCLEEYAKPLEPSLARELETLRYRTYALARSVDITQDSCRRLADVRLYVLLDVGAESEQFESLLRGVAPLIDAIQLRDKRLDDRRLLEAARRVRQVTRETDTLLIVNDRPDVALLAEADGVHLGQEDLPVRDARRIVGVSMLIGVSTHSIQQARQAVLDGADYLGCGPTFPSGTKAFDQFPGLEFLRAVHREIRLPCFAIGGIDLNNVSLVQATGLRRVAVSGCVGRAAEPPDVARKLRAILMGSADPPPIDPPPIDPRPGDPRPGDPPPASPTPTAESS